ncbi:hypothetical protein WDZ92_43515, partial [Nostoc sp. NIES-2111]
MSGSKSDAEPLVSQVPTAELRRVLSDRFRKEVADATWQKVARSVLFFGLPGIIAIVGVVWKLLDATIQTSVATAVRPAQDQLSSETRLLTTRINDISGRLTERMEGQIREAVVDMRQQVQRDINATVSSAVLSAFDRQRMAVLEEQLRQVAQSAEFTAFFRSRVEQALQDIFKDRYAAITTQFTTQLMQDGPFQDQLSRRIASALESTGRIREIIAAALSGAVRESGPENVGRMNALAVLAALDQPRANAAILDLLQRAEEQDHYVIALEALAHTGFRGFENQPTDADTLLDKALRTWMAHCASTRCTPGDERSVAMTTFFLQGRDLRDAERARWIAA